MKLLEVAASEGDVAGVKRLLAAGGPPGGTTDPKGMDTPIFRAFMGRHVAGRYDRWTPLMILAKAADEDGVRVLLEAGAQKKARNGDGKTAYELLPPDASPALRALLKP